MGCISSPVYILKSKHYHAWYPVGDVSMIMYWIYYKRGKFLWKSKRETLLPNKLIPYLDLYLPLYWQYWSGHIFDLQ